MLAALAGSACNIMITNKLKLSKENKIKKSPLLAVYFAKQRQKIQFWV